MLKNSHILYRLDKLIITGIREFLSERRSKFFRKKNLSCFHCLKSAPILLGTVLQRFRRLSQTHHHRQSSYEECHFILSKVHSFIFLTCSYSLGQRYCVHEGNNFSTLWVHVCLILFKKFICSLCLGIYYKLTQISNQNWFVSLHILND